MTCRELAEFVMQYLDEELSPEQRSTFDAHLEECPNCVAYLSNYAQTIQLGKAAFEDHDAPVPAEVPHELVDAILAARLRS